MSKMIQIRDVPDVLHRTLKSRAALEGKSLSSFLLEIVRESAERPPIEEVRRRLAALEPIHPGETSAMAVRAERDAG
jgi:plasmid stability protein